MSARPVPAGPSGARLAFCALLCTLFALLLGHAPAAAQERPRSLYELLFPERSSPSIQRVKPAPFPPAPGTPAARPAAKPAPRPSAAPRPAVEPAAKAEDARVVLVVGDFLAGGLAEGLASVFAADPGVRVVDRSNGSSGFVRDDHFDWPRQIGAILDAEKPAAAVVMMGSNDRQQMAVGGLREPLLGERWTEEYAHRLAGFAEVFRSRGVALVWIGLPSFKAGRMSLDMLAFNDLQRSAAANGGATYVDIWDGFVDEDGAFITNGPDINGQDVRLRSGDGINFTEAGKRKLAFYAEKPLARILQGVVPDHAAEHEPFGPDQPEAPAAVDRTPPMPLFPQAADGEAELLGLDTGARQPQDAAAKLIAEGLAPPAPPGRVDDFRVPPPATAARSDDRTSAIGAP